MNNQDSNKKNKIIVIIIVSIFIAPSILSWYVYNHTDFLQTRGTSNYGKIITPPVALEDLKLIDPLNQLQIHLDPISLLLKQMLLAQ